MRGIEVDAGADPRGSRPVSSLPSLSVAAQQHNLFVDARLLADVGATLYRRRPHWPGDRLRLQRCAGDRVGHCRRRAAHGSVSFKMSPSFWVLRGGGGYVIVTALHVRLIPIAEIDADAFASRLSRRAEPRARYRDWAAGAPMVRHLGGPLQSRRLRRARADCCWSLRQRIDALIGSQEAGRRDRCAAARVRRDDHEHLELQMPSRASSYPQDPENPVPVRRGA